MKLNPYLNFDGNAEEAVNFYKNALDGELVMLSRFGESPIPSADDEKQKIMHARIIFGGDNIIPCLLLSGPPQLIPIPSIS